MSSSPTSQPGRLKKTWLLIGWFTVSKRTGSFCQDFTHPLICSHNTKDILTALFTAADTSWWKVNTPNVSWLCLCSVGGTVEDQVECRRSPLIGPSAIILATVSINARYADELLARITDLQKANKVLRGAEGRKHWWASPVLSPQLTPATVWIQHPLCYCRRTFNQGAIVVVVL